VNRLGVPHVDAKCRSRQNRVPHRVELQGADAKCDIMGDIFQTGCQFQREGDHGSLLAWWHVMLENALISCNNNFT
jgi:hypothetical protein